MSTAKSSQPCVEVYYDGSCPLCRREIGVYQHLESDQPIQWVDVSDPGTTIPEHTTRDGLMARFHTRTAQGELLSGAAAFVHIWSQLPGWRILGHLAKVPGVLWLMEKSYTGFLKVRPSVQRAVRWVDVSHLPTNMVRDIRSDHAGETGAVWIYKGVLAASRSQEIREFAQHHLQTEQEHLQAMNALLPPLRRSWLLVPWRIAGFLTGFLPALVGPKAVYRTIESVETFVDHHYQAQIDRLNDLGTHGELKSQLEKFQQDECDHRDEAASKTGGSPSALARAWSALIGKGSAFAVVLARWV